MTRRWRVRVQFVPRDCWIGLFWSTDGMVSAEPRITEWIRVERTRWFICLVPMLPIVIERLVLVERMSVERPDPTRRIRQWNFG